MKTIVEIRVVTDGQNQKFVSQVLTDLDFIPRKGDEVSLQQTFASVPKVQEFYKRNACSGVHPQVEAVEHVFLEKEHRIHVWMDLRSA